MSAGSSTAAAFPDRVGKYELLLPLGTGGTATVYLARTRGVAGFEREVALKLVHAHLRADEESRLHLLEEARLAARIRHPNVVPVTEVDADACGVFLVMEYVEGEALSGVVRLLRDQNHRLPPRLIARIMNDSLAGLHAAHELRDAQGQFVGLVHRDFSPQNILLGVEGVTRLADFGVAKAASRTVRTKTGLVKGKVAYMSPEQARGHKVDRRCDVWAAGVVIWELLTGRKLYDHEDDVATLLSVVTEEPPRLKSVMQGVPPALDEAVAFALTSDVNSRCPSAEAFRCMLESAWDECGGMASPAELGAFVRQTVGQRLAERRASVARGRTTSVASTPSSNAAAPLIVSLAAPPRPPEDGTKTAISAAVPAAEHAGAWHWARAGRRTLGLAALLFACLAGAAIVGLTLASSERTTASERPVEAVMVEPSPVSPLRAEADGLNPEPASAAPPNRGTASLQMGLGDLTEPVPNPPDSVERQKPPSAAPRDTSNSDEIGRKAPARAAPRRSSRRSSPRTKVAARRAQPKAAPRAKPRPKKQANPPAPSATPRQRSGKTAAPARDAPAPLNLAPDPYDTSR